MEKQWSSRLRTIKQILGRDVIDASADHTNNVMPYEHDTTSHCSLPRLDSFEPLSRS